MCSPSADESIGKRGAGVGQKVDHSGDTGDARHTDRADSTLVNFKADRFEISER